jgi:Phosphopantetheine attachment site
VSSARNLSLCGADIAAGVMGTQAVDAGLPLMEQGLDSLAAVELRNGAAAAFGVPLGAAVALDHPTLEVVCWLNCFVCSLHIGVSDELQHVPLGRPAIDRYTRIV